MVDTQQASPQNGQNQESNGQGQSFMPTTLLNDN